MILKPRIFSMTSRSNSMQGHDSPRQIRAFQGFYRPFQHWYDFHLVCQYGWLIFCRNNHKVIIDDQCWFYTITK